VLRRFLLICLFNVYSYGQSFGYKMTTITTVPDSADLFLSGKSIGKSPRTFRVQDGLLAPKYIIRAEYQGYKTQLFPLKQEIKIPLASAGICCGLFFMPGLGLLIYSTEHSENYLIVLIEKDDKPIFDPNTGKIIQN